MAETAARDRRILEIFADFVQNDDEKTCYKRKTLCVIYFRVL